MPSIPLPFARRPPQIQRRWGWLCRRRRLVLAGTHPSCTTSRFLRWLAPLTDLMCLMGNLLVLNVCVHVLPITSHFLNIMSWLTDCNYMLLVYGLYTSLFTYHIINALYLPIASLELKILCCSIILCVAMICLELCRSSYMYNGIAFKTLWPVSPVMNDFGTHSPHLAVAEQFRKFSVQIMRFV
jgi:hypothetical protein